METRVRCSQLAARWCVCALLVGCGGGDAGQDASDAAGGAATNESEARAAAAPEVETIELTSAQFEEARRIYFDWCADCHGGVREGVTGPNIQPETTHQIGTGAISSTLHNGLPGGMPAGLLSEEQIQMMAAYLQMEPPAPPD